MRGALAAALRAPWLRDPLWARARSMPSLDLDPAGTGSLRDRVSGQNLVTFTRASDGTYVDSQGIIQTATTNAPRITHDSNGKCLGLLVEESRTNLLLQSEDFSTTWTTNGTCSVSTDQAVAPNGKLTADEITVNNGLTNYVGQSASVTSGTAYTLSVYVKAGTITTISFRAAIAGSDGYIVYAFATNNISIATPTFISSASSASLGNGWYRLSMQYTPTVSGAASIRIGGGNTNNGTCYTWGAQLEAGAFPTSYLKTEAAQSTRAADIATNLSGVNFNNLRGIYAEFQSPASGTRGIASLNDNTANERIALNTSGTDPLLAVVDGGVTQASVDAGSFTANTRTRLAARFNANDFAVSVNGGAEVVDTSGTMPTVDRLMIGRSQAGEYLNGPLARLTLWDRPPFNLQELTR